MRPLLHRIEVMVDALIPYLLIILALLLLGEVLFADFFLRYHTAIELYDGFVIAVFATDLTFKYCRVRNIKRFVHRYWLDIIATLPLFLVLRMFEELVALGRVAQFQKQIEQPQVIIHEGLLIERQALRIVREAERIGEISRFERFARLFGRLPRFLRAMPFFERPSGLHHLHER